MTESTAISLDNTSKKLGENEKVANFSPQRRNFTSSIQHILHRTPSLVPLIVLVLSITAFGVLLGNKFFSPFALTLILQQVAIVGIVGAAQSLVILTAGIDLSVGAIMVLSSVVMGQMSFHYGLPPQVAIGIGLCCGTMLGYINGWLVAVMRLPPFIVTLGVWQIVLATNFLYSANETIRSQDIEKSASLFHFFGERINIGGAVFTYGVIAFVLIVALLTYVLNNTAWGRHVYAVGDDPEAAELAGVETKKVLISVYMLGGVNLCICRLGADWSYRFYFTNFRSVCQY